MNKKQIFDNLANMVKKNTVISEVKTEENDASYLVSFMIYNGISGTFDMKKAGNICVIKTECSLKDEESEPSVVAQDITKNKENVRFTVYDGKMVFQEVVPYDDVAETDVETSLRQSLKSFLNLFINNAELFKCDFKEDLNEGQPDSTQDDAKAEKTHSSQVDNDNTKENTVSDEKAGQDDAEDREGGQYSNENKTVSNDAAGVTDQSDDDLDLMLNMLEALESAKGTVDTESKVSSAEPHKANKKQPDQGKRPDKKTPSKTADVSPDQGSTADTATKEGVSGRDVFTSQLDEMYKEFDNILKERESALDARELHLNQFAEDLKAKEQSIKSTRKELEEQRKNIRVELEAEFNSAKAEMEAENNSIRESIQRENNAIREALDQEKKELAFATNKLGLERKKVAAERATMETKKKAWEENIALGTTDDAGTESDSSIQISKLEETISQQKAVIEKFQEKREQWKAEKDDLLKQIADAKGTAGRTAPAESSVNTEDVKQQENRIKELEERINTLSMEKDGLESEKKDLESKIEDLKAENAKKAELNSGGGQTEDKQDMAAEAKDIIETTQKLGINMEIVPGNAEMILAGEQGDCTICVNVQAGMLYIEKPVKKTAPHVATLESWNNEDIRRAYFLGKNKVICKCKYDNAAKAINEILERVNSL